MLAGALGKGVPYPLDTIKTKQQTYAAKGGSSSGPLQVAVSVLQDEGLAAFYSGVSSTMVGEAVIKGAVFFSYEQLSRLLLGVPNSMIIAAGVAGAVASIVATPVERVKCVMQANGSAYANPFACIASLLSNDGVDGLLLRGFGATLLREVPAYIFYFTSYETVSTALLPGGSLAGLIVPSLVPVVGGAAAGVMCWVPVYPIDVIKTNIQVADGDPGDAGVLSTAKEIYEAGGVGAFYDGLGPKTSRAVINHAVTFYVYESICDAAAVAL